MLPTTVTTKLNVSSIWGRSCDRRSRMLYDCGLQIT